MDRREFINAASGLVAAVPTLNRTDLQAPSASPDLRKRIEGFPSWIEIDLDALGANLQAIRTRTGTDVMPVVKNNAYGHGLLPIVRHLAAQRVTRVFVADYREARDIRRAGLDVGVVNMGPIFSQGDFVDAVRLGVTQTVYDDATVEALSRAAASAGRPASVFVKVDTGLRRVGMWHERAAEFVERTASRPGITVAGIYSSLQQVPEQDKAALGRLLAVETDLKRRGVRFGVRSLGSSDAIFHFREAHLDLVRPGMSLYGIYPEDKDRGAGLPLRPVLSLYARIEQVKWVNEGDSVTYWGRFVAPKRMMLGTVHIGFHQVLPRELSNKGVVRYRDKTCQMVGSISLNHVVVDLTDTNAQVGEAVEVLGPTGPTSASEVAKTAGWMVYSLLNHLSPTTPRVYFEGGQPRTLLEG